LKYPSEYHFSKKERHCYIEKILGHFFVVVLVLSIVQQCPGMEMYTHPNLAKAPHDPLKPFNPDTNVPQNIS